MKVRKERVGNPEKSKRERREREANSEQYV